MVYNLSNSSQLTVATNAVGNSWSPVDHRLAYVASVVDGPSLFAKGLYLTETDGSTMTEPLELKGAAYSGTTMGMFAGWNSSGTRLLISASNDTGLYIENAQILMVNPQDGSSHFMTTLHRIIRARFSKDGSKVLHKVWRLDPKYPDGFDLYVMNSGGSGRKLLIEEIVSRTRISNSTTNR